MSILRAMVATRNACAGWTTCENCTGHCALSIVRSLRAIGSLAATVSTSSVRPNFCTVSCRRKEAEIQKSPEFRSRRSSSDAARGGRSHQPTLLGSARVSRAGERVLAIANFSRRAKSTTSGESFERLFRRDAETNTPDACATKACANQAELLIDAMRLAGKC